jgi:hypothetical protein
MFAHRLCAAARLLLCGYTVAKMSQRAAPAIRSMCSRFALALVPASRAGSRERWTVALWIQCCINVTPAARAGCRPRRFAARGRRAVARLLVGPKGSSMPIVRDPPSPLKYIGVPTDYPLDLDLDI